ncbi:MAG: arsenical pump-driving ATPase [Verrucomicrobiales bacterium]|nr:arsenical pump-driving ATPase [Verrucomicrobiales bacterium]
MPAGCAITIDTFLSEATRFLFFTGKGGVGKTSLACASALTLAESGKRLLLVSTDPASNLDEVLATPLGPSPAAIPGVPGLLALNVDPQAAADAYRRRLIAPLQGQLPDAVLRSMEEQLSGACTTEIAAFDEFTQWLGDPRSTEAFDHVVFDTAPTGHTLRLLALPGAWTGFLANNRSGTSCLGPLAGLEKQRTVYEAALAALRDGARSTVVLVSRPQPASLLEAKRASQELAALGVRRQRLILNGVFQAQNGDSIALAVQLRGETALRQHDDFLQGMPTLRIPLQQQNLVGIAALRTLLSSDAPPPSPHPSPASPPNLVGTESLDRLVEALAQSGRGVILTMGKGGVGKTTLAAAIATRLAESGFPVHLSTTDPAAHVAYTAGNTEGLVVSRIDPLAETRAYVEQVLATHGQGLDPEARALLEEDLRSPCTEEIAVFRAFARTVALGADRFVVLDTAPTGHTLLLLDATEAYHREIARKTSDLPDEVRDLLPRLRDPDWSRVLIVTVPEPTPVHEAADLQADLRRAGIEPFAWVINQSLAASGTRDPVLSARATGENVFLREVTEQRATRTTIVPWVAEEPVGPAGLRQLFGPHHSSHVTLP